MKNNKGYYSWIHSLNRAAFDARQKGIDMINEEKAKKASTAARAKMEAQLDAPPPAPTTRNLDALVRGQGHDGRDEEIIDVPDFGRYPMSDLKLHMAGAINTAIRDAEPDFEKPSMHSISLAAGDPAEFAKIKRMKIAQKSADLAKARGPVEMAPGKKSPNEIVADAEDGEIADEDGYHGGYEYIKRLPSYPEAVQARIDSGFGTNIDRDLTNARALQDTVDALQLRASGRHAELKPHHHELLSAHDAAAEEQAREYDASDRDYGSRALDASLEDRPQRSSMRMESVSDKISRLLNLSE
jgi:hypothetical protein